MAKYNDDIQKIDTILGKKISAIRLAKGLSRQDLAKEINVTHQQLQKYEKGINRISFGRLVLIAKALGEKIEYFCSDIDDTEGDKANINNEGVEEISLQQRSCLELSRNFLKIKSPEHQQAVSVLVRSLARVTEHN